MRTRNGLFDELTTISTLESAALQSARGKRRRADVSWFLFRFESEVRRLQSELSSGQWTPDGFVCHRIRDPKPRVIARASFADRVVHLAVARLLESVFARSRVDGVFACLPGLGTHRAVLRLAKLQRRHRFALHLDVRAYFPSIDPSRALALLQRSIRDTRFVDVVSVIFDSGRGLYDPPEVRAFANLPLDWPAPGIGLPIGAATSQVIAAHSYLNALDHRIKRVLRIPGYVRYVDDFFLFSDTRAQLRSARKDIGAWLEAERDLRLKRPDAPILAGHGTLHALGHSIRRDGIEALPRARRRFRGRVGAAWRDPGADFAALRRSSAASVGVLLFGAPWSGGRKPPDAVPEDPAPSDPGSDGGCVAKGPVVPNEVSS